jgi:predicted nucleic acid-binding protein
MIGVRRDPRAVKGAVVDASVAVKWFVPREWTEEAQAVLKSVATSKDRRFFVPEVFFAEMLSALKRLRDEVGEIHAALKVVSELPLRCVPWNEGPRSRTLDMALGSFGAYDAIYAALAIERRLPLLTADARLARALGEPDWAVVLR